MDNTNKTYEILKNMKLLKESIRKNIGHPFKELNLTIPQSMLMGILVHHGRMKIGDLSKKMGLSNSTVSGIIDRLENQNYVIRIRDLDDRRVIFVDLQEQFKINFKNKQNTFENLFNNLAENVSQEELEQVLKGLEILNKIFNEKEKL